MKMWNILWPLFIYIIAQNILAIVGMIVMMIILCFTQADAQGMIDLEILIEQSIEQYYQYAMLLVLIAALICIPIYYKMYKKERQSLGRRKKDIPITNKDIAVIAISGAALALAMNNIIALTPLPRMFPGYQETNAILYGGGILLQIICAGIFACIVEEVSMRGVVYLRMRRYWSKKTAMILSAVVFGLYHMNVVQAVYAFVLGLFFVWLYERYDSLWASCIGHMSANLFVILLSGSTVAEKVMNTLVGYCLLTCVSLLIFYYGWRWMKQNNPVVELEFVEKAPDTLESLFDEYQGHDREEK